MIRSMTLERKAVIDYVYENYLNEESPELSKVELFKLYAVMKHGVIPYHVHLTYYAFKKDIALMFDIDKNDYLFQQLGTIRILKDRYSKLYNKIYHNPGHRLYVNANL